MKDVHSAIEVLRGKVDLSIHDRVEAAALLAL